MRASTVAKWAGIPIATLAAIVVGIAHLLDADRIRSRIVAGLENATGREVSIDGKVDVSVSPRLSVIAEGLAVANAQWGSRRRLLEVGRVEAQLALLPLITGSIHFSRLVLVEPDLLLESDTEGVPNWEFEAPAEGATASRHATSDGSDTAVRTPARVLLFDRLEVHRGLVIHRNAQRGEETRFAIDAATLRAQPVSAPLGVELESTWNGTPFGIVGTVDSLEKLVLGSPIEVKLRAEIPGLSASVEGTVARPMAAAGVDLRIAATGDDLSALDTIAGARLPELGSFRLNGTLRGSAKALRIDDFRVELGESDLSGKITIARDGARPRVSGILSSTRFDLGELLPAAGNTDAVEARGAGAFDESPTRGEADRIFPARPLPLHGLKAADLDLQIGIGQLRTAGLPVTSIALGIVLDEGTLEVEPFSASVAGSRIEALMRLDTGASTPSLVVELNAPNLDLGELLTRSGVTEALQGTAALRARFQGSGNSVASLLAGLDGSLTLLASEGRLKTQAFDTVAGGATAIVGTLLTGRREWTVLNCAASVVDIRNGVAVSRVTLIDTTYSTVIATGSVDLASESLDLTLEPRAKTATLNVAVPVHVTGTLAEPRFHPDRSASIRKIGGLLGIALFPPAAIAALGELGSGDNQCLEIAGASESPKAASGQALGAALPVDAEKTVEKIIKGAGDLVDGIGDELESLFGVVK